MAKLVFGMMQSLDGYVAGVAGGPELPPPGIAVVSQFEISGAQTDIRHAAKPYFTGARPPLSLVATDPVGEDAVRLTFVST